MVKRTSWENVHHVVKRTSRGKTYITWWNVHYVVKRTSWWNVHHVVKRTSRGETYIAWWNVHRGKTRREWWQIWWGGHTLKRSKTQWSELADNWATVCLEYADQTVLLKVKMKWSRRRHCKNINSWGCILDVSVQQRNPARGSVTDCKRKSKRDGPCGCQGEPMIWLECESKVSL